MIRTDKVKLQPYGFIISFTVRDRLKIKYPGLWSVVGVFRMALLLFIVVVFADPERI